MPNIASKRKFHAQYQTNRANGLDPHAAWDQTLQDMASEYMEWLREVGASEEEIQTVLHRIVEQALAKQHAQEAKERALGHSS